jgi:hypothetical protein
MTRTKNRALANWPNNGVSVLDYGAVGDGVTDDRPAIAAAITAAAATGSDVLFPAGIYYKAGTGGGQNINVPAGVKLVATGKAEIKSEGFPIFTLNAGCGVSGITFNNLAGGVSIGLEIKGDDITIRDCIFQAGSQLIYLYTADRLVVDGCRFEQGCGYQVIQKAGFTSNDGRVVNCTSVNCTLDFVELNSEGANPCKNWLISGNFVKNLLNPSTPTSVQTECRFFGATATDGVIISNNVVDTIAGDSAIHCEGETKNLTVTGNLFIDCHSLYGKIFFAPNGTLVDSFIFSNNIIRYTPGFTAWTGEGTVLIQDAGNSSGRHLISSNSFTNESAVVMNVMLVSDTDDVVVSGNRVTGFTTVIQTGFGAAAGTGPRARKTVFFNNNILESCATGLFIQETVTNRHYRCLVDNNVFKDVTDVYNSGNNSMPESLTGNTCRGSTSIDEGKIIGTKANTVAVSKNWLDSDATSTRKTSQNYTDVNVAKTLFTPSSYGSWQLYVKCGEGSNINSNNSTAKVVRLDYNSPIDIDLTEISTSNSGTGAGFTLALSGTSVTFTATATRAVRVTLVSSFYPSHTPDTIAA